VPTRCVKDGLSLTQNLRRGSMKLCIGSSRSAQSLNIEKSLRKNPCKVCIGPTLSWSVEKSKSGERKECEKFSQETSKSQGDHAPNVHRSDLENFLILNF
jgi:hypothetical protein